MRILGATERVLKVFTITGLDRVFDIVEGLDEDAPASDARQRRSDRAGTAYILLM